MIELKNTERPTGDNADEWAAFLSENCGTDSIGFLAVQIAEAIEENVRRSLDATVTAVVHTIGGTDNDGNPTSSTNYLQRLRKLIDFEAKHSWQPISTAPKTAACIRGWDGNRMETILWAGAAHSWLVRWSDADFMPTHWQPLPEPPPCP